MVSFRRAPTGRHVGAGQGVLRGYTVHERDGDTVGWTDTSSDE
jgi:hypothetical protein